MQGLLELTAHGTPVEAELAELAVALKFIALGLVSWLGQGSWGAGWQLGM